MQPNTPTQQQSPSNAAPQNTQKSQWMEPATEYTDYKQVPFYRRRWSTLLLFLFFLPGLILVGLTGEFYFYSKGRVMRFSKKYRYIFILGSVILWAKILLH